MKVAVSGASGLVGRALCQILKGDGHEVFPLVRRQPRSAGEIFWNPTNGEIDFKQLSSINAVVHLAGENIADKRWTDTQKDKIRRSRVDATRLLAKTIADCQPGPRVLVAASAVGFYGDRGQEQLSETSLPGFGFLADLCRDWEESTEAARAAGIRVVHPRIGVVLSREGGALAKLLPIFQLGGGGPIGAGQQYMSWIDIVDLARALSFLLTHEISGPVNMVAPQAVTNAEFTRALAHELARPAFLPVPPFALRLMMGELADQLLLSSQRVAPGVLQKSGFHFDYPELSQSLHHVLADKSATGYATNP